MDLRNVPTIGKIRSEEKLIATSMCIMYGLWFGKENEEIVRKESHRIFPLLL